MKTKETGGECMGLRDIKLTPEDIKKFHAGAGERWRHKLFSDIMEWYFPAAMPMLALLITAIIIAP